MTEEMMADLVRRGLARWISLRMVTVHMPSGLCRMEHLAIETRPVPDLHRYADRRPDNPVVAPGGPAIYRLRHDLPGLPVR